jgi:hypothetical protein
VYYVQALVQNAQDKIIHQIFNALLAEMDITLMIKVVKNVKNFAKLVQVQ